MRIALGILIALAVSVAVQGASGSGLALREFGLYEIHIDGSARTSLLANPDIHEVGELSPDRTRFLFQYERRQPDGLYSAALDGSDVRLVASLPEQRGINTATWSPDGNRIAIGAYDLTPCTPTGTNCAVGEIWLAKADGGGLRQLVRRAIAPAWSRDSQRLAYIGSFNAYGEAGALTVGNTRGLLRARRLGPIEYGIWESWDLVWSPRGNQIGYTTVRRKGEPSGRARVAIAEASGCSKRCVHVPRAGTFAGWSPGGKRILYWEGRSGRLIVSWPDGRQRHLVTAGLGPAKWSPNGRWVAFVDEVGRGSQCYQLFLVQPDGQGRHQVTHEDCSARFNPFWSLDSKRLIYRLYVYDP